MIDLKMTPFMKIAAIVSVTILICFIVAASTIMFTNPEYIETAKRIIVLAGGAGLFFAVLLLAFNVAELIFAGIIAGAAAIGMLIVGWWKKLTKVDTIGDE